MSHVRKSLEIVLEFFVSNENLEKMVGKLEELAEKEASKTERNLKIAKEIERKFCSFYNAKFEIILFGSRATKLTTSETGDLDIFIDTDGNGDMCLTNDPVMERWALRELEKRMKSSSEWTCSRLVITCRTPILKVLHNETGLPCDITVRNSLGIVNTKLMALLLRNIPYFRQLLLVIREWAFLSNITKDINSYALSLLVLFFLQNQGYAPAVDTLRFEYNGPVILNSGYECINYDLVDFNKLELKTPTNESLKSLLIGFFEYYGKLNVLDEVICPLVGRLVKKKLFEKNTKKLPPEMFCYVHNLKSDGEIFKLCEGLNIQDPIDLAHNLTKSTSAQFVSGFREICTTSSKALQMLN